MFKPYIVTANSPLMEAEMRLPTMDEAFEVYNKFLNSPCYTDGNLYDANTGEVYAYFIKMAEGNGILTTTWTAVE